MISRSSTLGYRGKSVDAKQVSAELGVRYVVEGSVRRSGQRVRVGAQLVDAPTGHQLWSQRFDREVEDVFEIQEEIADAIAGQVGAELRASEGARAARREGQRLDAWELSARGWSLMGSLNPAAYAQARELCARAVELDPGFAKAWAGMSLAYAMEAATSKTPAESLARALETAERARDADPRSPLAHSMLGWAHGLSGDKRRWLAEQERAVELAPSSANGYDQLGVALWVNGRPLEAVEAARKAVRLSPNDPLIYLLLTNGAMSLFAAGQYEEAAEWAERSLLERTDDPRAHMWLTASYGQLGRVDAAARALEGLLGLDPAVVPPTQNVFDALTPPDYRRRFREGLRKAGWKGETR